jgi:hypothetical protein
MRKITFILVSLGALLTGYDPPLKAAASEDYQAQFLALPSDRDRAEHCATAVLVARTGIDPASESLEVCRDFGYVRPEGGITKKTEDLLEGQH